MLWLLASTAGLAIYVNTHQDIHTATTAYTVRQGDSVWTIAQMVDRRHTGFVADEILQMNVIRDENVEPGDVIQIPMGEK